MLAYRNYSNSNYGTAIVGTVSGNNTISFGTSVVFKSAATYNIKVTYDSTNQKVVVVYTYPNPYRAHAKVGTVSGTSIIFLVQRLNLSLVLFQLVTFHQHLTLLMVK